MSVSVYVTSLLSVRHPPSPNGSSTVSQTSHRRDKDFIVFDYVLVDVSNSTDTAGDVGRLFGRREYRDRRRTLENKVLRRYRDLTSLGHRIIDYETGEEKDNSAETQTSIRR